MAPKPEESPEAYEPQNIVVYRKEVVTEAPTVPLVFQGIAEYFAPKPGGPSRVWDELEFVAHAHVFTLTVKPVQ